MSTHSKKFTPGKSIPQSKEALAAAHAAENAKIDAEMKRYQANAAFLAKIVEGETASHKARFEEAQAEKAAQQYPFQGQTFDPNPQTFQPQSMRPSWTYSNGGW
jgi:hypothetical protein